jgi:hypothetical protein
MATYILMTLEAGGWRPPEVPHKGAFSEAAKRSLIHSCAGHLCSAAALPKVRPKSALIVTVPATCRQYQSQHFLVSKHLKKWRLHSFLKFCILILEHRNRNYNNG